MTQPTRIIGSALCRMMGVRFFLTGENTITASFTPDAAQEGPPGHVHGGVLATVLDEAMGMAAWSTGKMCVAVNLNVSYKNPVSLGSTVQIHAKVDRVEGRKVFTVGTITLPEDAVAVEGQGVFVEAPQFFTNTQGGFRIGAETDDV